MLGARVNAKTPRSGDTKRCRQPTGRKFRAGLAARGEILPISVKKASRPNFMLEYGPLGREFIGKFQGKNSPTSISRLNQRKTGHDMINDAILTHFRLCQRVE